MSWSRAVPWMESASRAQPVHLRAVTQMRPLSADAEVAINIRTRANLSAMLAIAAAIQLQPDGHRTRCFEPDINMLLPVAVNAED